MDLLALVRYYIVLFFQLLQELSSQIRKLKVEYFGGIPINPLSHIEEVYIE